MSFMEKLSTMFGKKVKVSKVSSDYVELDSQELPHKTARILVKYFVLSDYNDVKPILNAVREGYSITFIKVQPLRAKDPSELRRAIEKIKATCRATNSKIMGIDENYVVTAPDFADIIKG
ncbi:MAG TPA: DUF552 domain-containing protein [Candidatus Aenigmarchaeota archaeon]|nr:MAG: hypothetical protein DRN75_03180 [Nanoarchaeota archaeon]HDO79987.1 DUF552 domain-containing protein [Candidatus Aenigmarchaeota archaeon]HEX33039.1 DUF552 domain-containing protein [Candidatus Aenigmarchaeota archaeon]